MLSETLSNFSQFFCKNEVTHKVVQSELNRFANLRIASNSWPFRTSPHKISQWSVSCKKPTKVDYASKVTFLIHVHLIMWFCQRLFDNLATSPVPFRIFRQDMLLLFLLRQFQRFRTIREYSQHTMIKIFPIFFSKRRSE